MEDDIEKEIYVKAMKITLKVDFLESKEEVKMYAASLYNAMMWGKKHTVKVKY